MKPLARLSHQLPTVTADASVLRAFRSLDLLDLLHEYDCGDLGRKPCQAGASTASRRQLVRNGHWAVEKRTIRKGRGVK